MLIAALSASAFAGPSIPLSEYRERREAIRKALPNSVVILFGAREDERGDLRSPFFQKADFYYLTGWTEPGAILAILPDRDILFLPRTNPEAQKWTGRKGAPDDPDIKERTGFEHIIAAEAFESKLAELVAAAPKIYTMSDPGKSDLRALLPLREIGDAAVEIARLRMKKSPAEIAMIQHATDATIDAHRAAWKRMQAGLHEYQIASAMSAEYFDRGCERHAYPPIVGSGPTSLVLHYSRNKRRIDNGELVLMDVGAECSYYTSDITRTVPVNGKFTARQRELYEIVLGAQKAAIAAAKPGATLGRTTPNSLYQVALNYLNSHGKDRKGEPLGQYFTHGIGHHVGLDVHDANDPAVPLAPGMVVTIEPGLYIRDEGIGIRIEDVILITEDGAKVLSSTLPREVREVERAMSR
jgi:Xaa-Pro aminopeptidase